VNLATHPTYKFNFQFSKMHLMLCKKAARGIESPK
jgi:hypothetical protein